MTHFSLHSKSVLASFWLAVSVLATHSDAQPIRQTVQFVAEEGADSVNDRITDRLREHFVSRSKQARELPWDARAEYLYDASVKSADFLLNVNQPVLVHRGVYNDPVLGDATVVLWTVATKSGETGSLLLVDTSIQSRYSFRFTGQSRSGFIATGSTLVVKQPLRGGPVRVQLGTGPDGEPRAWFSDDYTISSNAWVYEVLLQGGWAKDESFLDLTVGKGFLRGFYGDTLWVPERIPPLVERVKFWPDEQVSNSLSRLSKTGSQRDIILIQELVRRNLSEASLVRVMEKAAADRDPSLLEIRTQDLLFELAKVASPGRIDAFRIAGLEYLRSLGSKGKHAARRLFPLDCVSSSNEWEARAVEGLGSDALRYGSLTYLGRCGGSAELLERVRSLTVPPDERGAKNVVESDLQIRFHQPGKPPFK